MACRCCRLEGYCRSVERNQLEFGHYPAGRESLTSTVSASGGTPAAANIPGDPGKRAFAFAHRNGHQPPRVNWNYVWLPFVACVLLSAALATYTYRVGRSRHSEAVSDSSTKTRIGTEALEQQISDADHERQVLRAQLGDRDRVIANLRRQVEQQSSSLEQMETVQASLEQIDRRPMRPISSGSPTREQVWPQKLRAAQASRFRRYRQSLSRRGSSGHKATPRTQACRLKSWT